MLLISFTVLRKPNVIGLYLLQLYAKNLHLDEKVDLQTVAAFCNGYVGADLEALLESNAQRCRAPR